MTDEEEPQEGLEPQEALLERLISKALESNRVVIDFDVIALMGLTAAIYTVGPQKIQEAFLSFMTACFGTVAEAIGNPIAGAGDALGDFWKWLTGG